MFAITVDMNMPVEQAIAQLRQSLQKEKMGIVSEIDFQATMKEKLNHSIPPYFLLGICGPGYAKRVIEADPDMGALLPCSCAVFETSTGKSRIAIQHPDVVAAQTDKADIRAAMKEALEALTRVAKELQV